MNDIIKIIKSLENLGVLLDGVTETVQHDIKRQKGGFLGALLVPSDASIVQPGISSVVKVTNYFNYKPQFNSVFFKK